MSQSLPVVADVDIVIIGGTAAATEYALAARNSGASVLLVGGSSYVGEEICTEFRYWLGADERPQTELSRSVYATSTEPPMPMHVKLTLEQALVAADVQLLLNTHPFGVLRTAAGQVGGVVIANRAGRQAVRARLVVDATARGQVLAQAGGKVTRLTGPVSLPFVTVGTWKEDADGSETLVPFNGVLDSKPYTMAARRCSVNLDLGDGSYAAILRATADAVERTWALDTYLPQDRLALGSLTDATSAPAGLVRLEPTDSVLTAMATAAREGAAAAVALPPSLEGVALTVYCEGAEPLADGEIRCLDDALRPGVRAAESIPCDVNTVPRLARYDVVVVGGGTGGAPAAIGAARAGATTLVVESTTGLGGVGTMGQISNYWFGNCVGFTAEVDTGVAELETDEKVKANRNVWTPPAKKAWYHRQCHGLGVDLAYGSVCVGTWVKDGRVCGVLVVGPEGYGLVEAGCVVDASGCADVVAAAGGPTVVIDGEHVAVQGTGLAALNPGRRYFNSDHSFSDDTDVVDATAFLVSSKLKFKDHFDAQQLVDSRERRRIVGDIELSPADFVAARRFPDTICVASSNFDTHGFTIHPIFAIKPPNHDRLWVDVPFRVLLPQGLDGVLATGLGVSAHRDAVPVIRMQPDVQNHGYAAGRAAAESARRGCALRDIDLKALQQHLVEIGSLPERVLTDVDNRPLPAETVQQAVLEQWDEALGLAVIFAESEQSIPVLRAAYRETTDEAARLRYAQCLALLGEPDGAATLRDAVAGAEWDDGWNYRGMGQFGMSMSSLDALIVALGRAGDASAWPVLLDKIATLPEDPAFSHCRALVLAAESLYRRVPHADAAPALRGLLAGPDMSGHVQADIRSQQAALTADPCENRVRNVSLRELVLARGLFRCGDCDGVARGILEAYCTDLRGHYARHARAVLVRG